MTPKNSRTYAKAIQEVMTFGKGTLTPEELKLAIHDWAWVGSRQAVDEYGTTTYSQYVLADELGVLRLVEVYVGFGTKDSPVSISTIHGSVTRGKGLANLKSRGEKRAYSELMEKFPHLAEDFLLPHLKSDLPEVAKWAWDKLSQDHGHEIKPEPYAEMRPEACEIMLRIRDKVSSIEHISWGEMPGFGEPVFGTANPERGDGDTAEFLRKTWEEAQSYDGDMQGTVCSWIDQAIEDFSAQQRTAIHRMYDNLPLLNKRFLRRGFYDEYIWPDPFAHELYKKRGLSDPDLLNLFEIHVREYFRKNEKDKESIFELDEDCWI